MEGYEIKSGGKIGQSVGKNKFICLKDCRLQRKKVNTGGKPKRGLRGLRRNKVLAYEAKCEPRKVWELRGG